MTKSVADRAAEMAQAYAKTGWHDETDWAVEAAAMLRRCSKTLNEVLDWMHGDVEDLTALDEILFQQPEADDA